MPPPKRRKYQPDFVMIDRDDLEAFHRDLELMGKWCRQSLYELAQLDRGKGQWPTITRVMCAAASWRGRLSVALSRKPGVAEDPKVTPLRLLDTDCAGWDDDRPEMEPAPPPVRRHQPCRPHHQGRGA